MALRVSGVSCVDGIAKAFPLHFLAQKDSSSFHITVLIIYSIKLWSPRGPFTWCNNLVWSHGTSLFPVGFAPIQRQRKLKKRHLLTTMIANAIYVCKHVQCIFSVNFGCTAMVLPLLKVPRFVHLFHCTHVVYVIRKQRVVGLALVPALYGRKDRSAFYLC